ncbi:MAG: DUF1045 domain-containing protein [Pseudomonadota bacterium]
MRFGLYFIPDPTHPLWKAGAEWLGRDIYSDQLIDQPDVPGLSRERVGVLTVSPRRYGFHATMKAPFRLASECRVEALFSAFESFCDQTTVFDMPDLEVSKLGPFYALVPSKASNALNELAADVVAYFEPFRAPLTEAEIAKRNPERLSDSERANLSDWGYPYVFDDFRFHMTLTEGVEGEDSALVGSFLETYFNEALARPLLVERLALVVEPSPGAPFVVRTTGRFSLVLKTGTA